MQTCVDPTLEVWYPPIMKYFTNPAPLNCSHEKNWISVHRGRFIISPDALTIHGDIQCMYSPIVRGRDDGETYFGANISVKRGDLITSDAFKVYCSASDGSSYINSHSSVMLKPELQMQQNEPSLKETAMGLDILIFGVDSMSHMTWLRNLPKTHAYFTQELGGLVFDKYNVVGYNTGPAMLAMLTGHMLSELPEVRQGVQGAQYLDNFPWLFREFKHAGYVTQWGEDAYNTGTFTDIHKGFQKQPADHYLRPFYMKLPLPYLTDMEKNFCLGSEPKHRVMTQSILDLYSLYENKPKFTFMFHIEFSHDTFSLVRLIDDDLVSFLQTMKHNNWLNNTFLILMSDHGARFGELRATPQGRHEQRLPYFGIRLPYWFEHKYPDAAENLRKNKIRLTTPFDVHRTLQETLNYGGPVIQSPKSRGLSLFHEVPKTRTCDDAGIAPEWCVCLIWQKISKNHIAIQRAASQLISTLNSHTEIAKQKCHRLKLAEIIDAKEYKGNHLTQNEASRDSKLMFSNVSLYQIDIKVHPSGALFETTVAMDVNSRIMPIKIDEVNRLNRYDHQSACIEDSYPYLKPFCYCRS